MRRMASATTSLRLPASRKAAWVALVFVGAAMVTVGGREMWRSDLHPEQHFVGWFGCGAGIFLAFFALLMIASRAAGSVLEIGDGRLTIVTRADERASLPLDTLAGVEVVEHNGREGCVVTLRKKDGGVLELCAFDASDNGNELAATLRDAIAANQATRGFDPLHQLAAFRDIAHERRGDSVAISWATSASPMALLALGPVAGLAIIVYGFHLQDPSFGTLIALGFNALLGLLVVGGWLWTLGTRERVTVDARHVTMERLRHGRVEKNFAAPVFDVVTVDYTCELTVKGAMLTLRTGQGRELEAIASLLASSYQIPLGRLSLAAKIALDLALSAEIERRSGKV
jgi:hypothetical protein